MRISRNVTFSCGRDELCIWRNSLCYRYSAITNNELSVEINDYDINDSVLGGIPLLVPLPPPSELSKTVIRIYCEKAKGLSHSILQLKPLALYFARAETALAGIPMNVKSLSTMLRHSWITKMQNNHQTVWWTRCRRPCFSSYGIENKTG